MGFLKDLTGSSGRRRARVYGGRALSELAPYSEAGTTALSQLQNFDPSSIANDPDYQFRLAQGANAYANRAAFGGGSLSGANLAALSQYNQGLAGGFADTAYGRLASLAQMGYGAAGQRAGIQQGIGQQVNAATQWGTGNIMGLINNGVTAAAMGFGGAPGGAAAGGGAAPGVTGGTFTTNPLQLSAMGQAGGFGTYNPNLRYVD